MQKSYLVTGATSGIGLAICEKILLKGDIVIAVGRNESKLVELKSKYSSDSLQFVSFDLSNILEIESIFNVISINNIKLDGFVHCAGMEETIPLTLYTPEKVNRIFEINVFSAIELLRFFSKKKYSNDNASVVLFSSVMGILGQPGKVGYCATKAAIIGIAKSSALELAKRRIRVNAVLPGVVNTPMTQKLFFQLEQSSINSIINMHPLGIGEVDDVVPIVDFLLSDGSRWMTGQNLIIDGGYSIQ
jgi:NAD(P)-dependent dehydrogenase (short-subunit alcohol dehydrogenase family)